MRIFSNQSGLAPLAVVLLVGITGVVGFTGYHVYETNKQRPQDSYGTPQKAEKKEIPKPTIPNGWTEFNEDGISFYHPKTWINAELNNYRKEDFALKDKASTLSIAVYKAKPRIYSSANAPFFCKLDKDTWNSYEIVTTKIGNGTVDETKDVKRGACGDSNNPLSKETINNNDVYSAEGGALGLYRYIVVVKIENGFVVLEDNKEQLFNGLPESEKQPDYSAENDKTRKDLVEAVNNFVKEFTKVN